MRPTNQHHTRQTPLPVAQAGRGVGSHTAVQAGTLERLRLLLALQRSPDTANVETWKRKALAKAVYSVFLDCVALGLEQEAKAMLRSEPREEEAVRNN